MTVLEVPSDDVDVDDSFQLLLLSSCRGRVVVLMGSYGDDETAIKIRDVCATYGITCELRVTSAHKGPDATLKVVTEYEGLSVSR